MIGRCFYLGKWIDIDGINKTKK